MKKKVLMITVLLIFVAFFTSVTYSFFNSATESKPANQGIASFVFNAEKVDKIELDLNGLVPGEEREYNFSITNSKDEKISDVTIEYQLNIKTYHFIPLNISIYSVVDEKEELVGTCDEKSGRNELNELVCNMPIKTLNKSELEKENYKMKIIFPAEYNDISYSNLVDYINIEIESWQKI